MLFNSFDKVLIKTCKICAMPLARFSLFIVFFWFGILKIFYVSPANNLVEALLVKTLPFSFETFIVFLGLLEMMIGVLFLIPKMERLAILVLVPHMITTILPLFMLSDVAWQAPFVLTLEGQYIVKNIALVSLAFVIGSHLAPLRNHHALSRKRH